MNNPCCKHIASRDNYDKEVKALKANNKEPKSKEKNKKPAMPTYTPPRRQQPDVQDADQVQGNTSKCYLNILIIIIITYIL